MSEQDVENKRGFFQRLRASEGRSRHFAQFLFLGVGTLLTLSAFFILQSFVHDFTAEERSRASDDFIEEVVSDFYALTAPLESLSSWIALSQQPEAADIRAVLGRKQDIYQHYTQILWFYQTPEQSWGFKDLLSRDGEVARFQVSATLLKTLLDQGALSADQVRLVKDVDVFATKQHRQSPKILSGPFTIVQAVEKGNAEKGFLLAVIDTAQMYGESWIRAHRYLSYMRVKNVAANAMIFEFDRMQGEPDKRKPVYEFPFGGENWEISSVVTEDPRSRFLSLFPHIVGVFGLLLVAAGAFYIRAHQKQADTLADMNVTLEHKNSELKAEAKRRERLSRAIEQAEQQSRAVIDAVGDIIFETDDKGEIVFLNKAWKKMTGFDVEQSIGQALVQLIYPSDQDEVSQDFKALLGGELSELRRFTQLRVQDGTFKAVELVMKMVAHNDEGQLRVIGTFTDIEERRRAERALSDAEKKYRSIVENAAGGIYQLTPEGLYLSANKALARMLGFESPELLLREVKNANEQLYVDAAQRREFYNTLQQQRDAVGQEVRMRQRDGEIIWVRESARAVVDERGELLFIEGSLEDVTDRKKSEAAIHEAKVHSDLANRAKSEFLSNMSHELRTPLNSIIGFSEMIKNEVYGKIENRSYWEYARDIHESGTKLLQVINEILDISKIEAGERQLNEGVVSVRNVVDGALDLLQSKIDGSGLIITKALDDVPDVIGEELALKQILLNLLSNAVKYTPDQGRITISGHVNRDGRLHISVTDTGIGLDDYEIQKALSPFGQVESDLDRKGSGTGLGLTLVDALVKLHGGEFELFSQKGIGTTATMILPVDRIVKSKEKPVSKDVEVPDNKTEEDV